MFVGDVKAKKGLGVSLYLYFYLYICMDMYRHSPDIWRVTRTLVSRSVLWLCRQQRMRSMKIAIACFGKPRITMVDEVERKSTRGQDSEVGMITCDGTELLSAAFPRII